MSPSSHSKNSFQQAGGPPPLGLYVHVPFCARKCPYCDFYSLPYRRETVVKYMSAITAEMRSYTGQTPAADTLYFGGGTPSLLSPEQVGEIIAAAKECFRLSPGAEITMEANPNTVQPSRLEGYRAAGVNRISFGVQSSDARELEALGRAHSPRQAAEAVHMAWEAGIQNISADLMLGTPYQTVESVTRSISFLAELPLSHVSAYLLKPEENTPYWGSSLLKECAGEDAADIYLSTVRGLEAAGFQQYEISNFARPGRESIHNLKYWKCVDYLGFGPAAHSCFRGRRFCHAANLPAYLAGGWREQEAVDSGDNGVAGSLEERVMLGLRLAEGIPLEWLDILPQANRAAFLALASRLASGGLAKLTSSSFSLSAKGFLISNSILSELLQFVTN